MNEYLVRLWIWIEYKGHILNIFIYVTTSIREVCLKYLVFLDGVKVDRAYT